MMKNRAMHETMGMTIAMTMVSVPVGDDEDEDEESLFMKDAAGQMLVILHEVWLVVQAEQEVHVLWTR